MNNKLLPVHLPGLNSKPSFLTLPKPLFKTWGWILGIKRGFILTIGFLFIHFLGLKAQNIDSLNSWIKEGLENNITLKQKKIGLENSLLALKMAKSYFLPNSAFSGNYSTASGGRFIDLPLGDLFNPIYQSLNQLTQKQAYSPISNQSIHFLPNNFYDVRLHTTLNIYNSDLNYAKKIQSEGVKINQEEIDIYKRELIYQIKAAYYQFLNAASAITIYQSGYKLVEKNIEVNQSLIKNGKGLPANLLRVKGEREIILAQLNEAHTQKENAQAYFNFLLNRDIHSPVVDMPLELVLDQKVDSLAQDISQREELREIGHGQALQKFSLDMKRAYFKPKVNAFLDLGSQNSNFVLNSQSIYYLTGVQIDIPLFIGKRNIYAIQQGHFFLDSENLNFDYTLRQLKLSAFTAANEVKAAWKNFMAARAQFQSSQAYFHLQDRGFREGTNTLLEYLDGRNQLTSSEIQMSLRYYDFLRSKAHLERETASYIF